MLKAVDLCSIQVMAAPQINNEAEPYIAMGQGGQLPPQNFFFTRLCAGQHCVRRPKVISHNRSTRRVNTATRASYTRLQQTTERAIYSKKQRQRTWGGRGGLSPPTF